MKNLLIILTFMCLTVKAQQQLKVPMGVPMGNVMPGPNGVYGLIVTADNATFNMYKPAIRQYDIYKDEKGNGNFKKIITLTFPSSYTEFTKRIGEAGAAEFKGNVGVRTDEEAYRVLLSGDPKKIGFLFLSKDFLQAVGAVWQDKDIKNIQPATVYKLVKVSSQGDENILFEQKISDIQRIPFTRYQIDDLISTDSSTQVTWASKTANPPAFFGAVYKKLGTEKEFRRIDKSTFIYNAGDTSKTFYAEKVSPGQLIQYYMVPEDYAGNPGLPSDTAFAVSKSFSQIKGISDFKLKDSLKGAWLSWQVLPNEGIYKGIQILKSRKSTSGFVEIATVSPNDSTYFDRAVIADVNYFYQIRPLIIGAKGYSLLPSATANIALKNTNEIPFAPQGLKVWQDSTAQVKLIWELNPEIDQFAYYVLRGTSKDDMRIVSPALRTNVYTDSLKNLDGQTTYFYGIKLMNINQRMSEISNAVVFKPLKIEFVPFPSGLSARYTENAVKLLWENMIEKHDDIIGYRVYRKSKSEKEFKLLNNEVMKMTIYEDTTVVPGTIYEYGVSAVNTILNQSILSPVASVSVPINGVLMAPADLYLLNKPEGVFITWPGQMDEKFTNLIYRKTPMEADFKQIAEVNTGDNYVDKTTQIGVLYSYRIVAKNKLGTSAPSLEKSIRRN